MPMPQPFVSLREWIEHETERIGEFQDLQTWLKCSFEKDASRWQRPDLLGFTLGKSPHNFGAFGLCPRHVTSTRHDQLPWVDQVE